MHSFEVNFEGLVGPTHHYAGLSIGNLASTQHAHQMANPKAAALQGIEKMRLLLTLGVKCAILPPHPRPNLPLLHNLGFRGSYTSQIQQAKAADINLLSACYSASGMWTANAATVAPSRDTLDGKVHFTPANLISTLHRHQEASFTSQLLQYIFASEDHFCHHPPLAHALTTADEGAANHSRLCQHHETIGTHLFVYGKKVFSSSGKTHGPKHYPARQTLEASMAVARNHLLQQEPLFLQQHPQAIDAGVFHNDVIALANESLLFMHERAFINAKQALSKLQNTLPFALNIIEVPERRIPLKDAVQSYLFNSQLVTLSGGKMTLIAPIECEEHAGILQYIQEIIEDPMNPIESVHFINLRQSMHNGGGPACLRLRIVLTETELAHTHPSILLTEEKLAMLEDWVHKHYRTNLHANDLDDPQLIDECFTALDALTTLLHLGSIYYFQKT